MVPIKRLWFSQKCLKRADNLTNLFKLLWAETPFSTKIELNLAPDGEYEIKNGHHRVVAIWLTGRTYLENGEYILVDKDKIGKRFGKIEFALERLDNELRCA